MTTRSNTNQHWTDVLPEGPLLRPTKAAEFLAISVSNYYALAKIGEVPAPVKITSSGRASGVPKSQLDAFVLSRAAAFGGSEG